MSLSDVYHNGFDEESGKTISANTCPECSGSLATDGGEITCTDCGLVVDEYRFDHSHERYSFDDETNVERTGAPLTPARHDRGLSTDIGRKTDANGNTLSGRKRRQLARLRREHSRASFQTKAERNLAQACSEIARMASALELPSSLREEASMIYRRAQEEDLIVGRSIETLAAGSLYAACRCSGIPRQVGEIAAVARCSAQKIELGYRVLNQELDLAAQVVGVSDRIPQLASACPVRDAVRHRALELATIAERTGIANGRNPSGVAAGCLYLAGRELDAGLTQQRLADLADVTPMTLRRTYTDLRAETE